MRLLRSSSFCSRNFCAANACCFSSSNFLCLSSFCRSRSARILSSRSFCDKFEPSFPGNNQCDLKSEVLRAQRWPLWIDSASRSQLVEGSYSGKYEDYSFLGCDIIELVNSINTAEDPLPSTSGCKMEAAGS
jgi:hypothetical protein